MLKRKKLIQKTKRVNQFNKHQSLVVVAGNGEKGLPDKNKKYTMSQLQRFSHSTLQIVLQNILNYQPKEEPDFLPPPKNIRKSKLIVLILKYQQ